jgi:Flp pilus assembly pilin Flp
VRIGAETGQISNRSTRGEMSGLVWATWEKIMQMFKRLIADERGGEVLEYALIAGLIVVAAIAVITTVGQKVLAKWNSVNSAL